MHLVFVNRQYPKFIMRMPRIRRARRRLEMLIEQVLAEHESKSSTEKPEDLVDDLIELHRSAPRFHARNGYVHQRNGAVLGWLGYCCICHIFRISRLAEAP